MKLLTLPVAIDAAILIGAAVATAIAIALTSCASKTVRVDPDEIALRYSAGILSLPTGAPLTEREMELHGLIEQYLIAHGAAGIPRDPAARYDHFIEWLNATHRY